MYKHLRLLGGVILAATALGANAQAVIFPQQTQAGPASATESSGTYTLSNDLLSASFTTDTDGHLIFNGCDALGLQGGTQLFTVTLGDGTTISSSDLVPASVDLNSLTGKSDAVRGSERFDGYELVATYTAVNSTSLDITWRAVLRNGSHYIRTVMELTGNGGDVAMKQITPMFYNVDTDKGGVPAVVGNTRGAILASSKIFAGLETPMGKNSVINDATIGDGFTPEAFAPALWTNWTVQDTEIPSGITGLSGYDADCGVSGARGYVSMRQAGDLTLTFKYSSGNHKLSLVGVDALDPVTGEVLASDYHFGSTGNSHTSNTYTLTGLTKRCYLIRYFAYSSENESGTYVSALDQTGTITWDKKYVVPTLVYDLESSASSAPALRRTAASSVSGITYGFSLSNAFTWDNITSSNWTKCDAANLPSGVSALLTSTEQAATYYRDYEINVASGNGNGTMTVSMVYTSGNHGTAGVGVEILNSSNEVLGSHYECKFTGGSKIPMVYTVPVTEAGDLKIRVWAYNKGGDSYQTNGAMSLSYVQNETTPHLYLGYSATNLWTWGTIDSGYWGDVISTDNVPQGIHDHLTATQKATVHVKDLELTINADEEGGDLVLEFLYSSGNHRLDICGVELIKDGSVIVSDYHNGYAGNLKENNVYTLAAVPQTGDMTLRVYMYNNEGGGYGNTNGNISITSYDKEDILHLAAASQVSMQGVWSRNTTLASGKTWKVGAVVGIVAPDQQRRSVLAYSERERAVPWRPMTIYNSWYELNINRNNATAPTYSGNFTIEQCVDVVNQWKTNLKDAHDANVESFVWDDGWDEYGTWEFNCNFPNGFKEADDVAKAMGSSIGCWLGPVGGYGTSGTYRKAYWSSKGGMQLSNPDYYDVFLGAVSRLTSDYQFNFFKFDGISAQFSSVGPDSGTTGEENAEAIIDIEQEVRKIKPDLFLNTTVGTWASPFWYQYADATWRQEQDHGTIGNGANSREKWITYRDRLVHQNYVTNSPLCPINSLMTHGMILTNYGATMTDARDYASCLRELRCAFACGSAMVELYCDYSLLNSIESGALWGDIAECIKWQKKNADVLPDIHWVGGNPWNTSTSTEEVYGWASWNGKKCTLALRNGKTSEQTFTTTLREALEIPEYVTGNIVLEKSFTGNQDDLQGLTTGESINIDTPLTLTLPASSVFCFDGKDPDIVSGIEVVEVEQEKPAAEGIYDLMGRRLSEPRRGAINIINGRKVLVK